MDSSIQVNRYIDHAVLKPDMTPAEAEEHIRAGIGLAVRTVCVRPCDIPLAVRLCKGTETGVSCVLAFPHGCALSADKAADAARYAALGVDEIDMVCNIGWARAGLWDAFSEDVAGVVEAAHPAGVIVKVILETAYLTAGQAAEATEASIAAKADFVKTSTGFASAGATEEMVRTMVEAAKGRIAVKASGGIRTREQAERFIALGAARLGVGSTSSAALCGRC